MSQCEGMAGDPPPEPMSTQSKSRIVGYKRTGEQRLDEQSIQRSIRAAVEFQRP